MDEASLEGDTRQVVHHFGNFISRRRGRDKPRPGLSSPTPGRRIAIESAEIGGEIKSKVTEGKESRGGERRIP